MNPRFVMLVAGATLVVAGALAVLSYINNAAAAAKVSSLELLIAEQEIRQQIVLYELLADGDGVTRPDIQALADQVLAPDVAAEVYRDNGTLMARRMGTADMVKQTPPSPEGINRRHYMIATYFDELTPTSAKTRTMGIDLRVTKNFLGAECAKAGVDACGGRITHAGMLVYHDTWAKTPEGWRKTRYTIYGENVAR